MTTVAGDPEPPLPASAGTQQRRWYRFSSDAEIDEGEVEIEIPYASAPAFPHLYQLRNGVWAEIAAQVHADRRMISGSVKGLGTVAIADGRARIRPWLLPLVALAAAIGLLLLFLRGRKTAALPR